MSYLMNSWYCAAWGKSLAEGEIREITIVDQSLVLFRDSDGAVAALENRCPHRSAPLDRGRMCQGRVQCGYHGLLFDRSGACVENPHGKGLIPADARVRAYPSLERHGILWVWMGDQAADPTTIPDFSAFDPDTAWSGTNYIYTRANYQLDVDNVLDLSHIQYMHGDTLGSDAVNLARTEVVQNGSTVHSIRYVTGEQLSPFLEKAFFVEPGTPVDRVLDMRWDPPSCLLLTVSVTPTGRPVSEGHTRQIAHIFTPETATTSHYWVGLAYPKSMGAHAQKLAEEGIVGLCVPLETEDVPMLEAQQRVLGTRDLTETKPVMLEGDAGANRARRVLARLMAAEKQVATKVTETTG